MPSDASTAGQTQSAVAPATAIVIPDEVKAKFGEIISLVLASESMNDEERQYWVNILPVMTPEQVQNLKDILDNEKKQLAAIDQKYSQDMDKIGQQQFVQQVGEERQRRMAERSAAEATSKQAEAQATDDILNQINAI